MGKRIIQKTVTQCITETKPAQWTPSFLNWVFVECLKGTRHCAKLWLYTRSRGQRPESPFQESTLWWGDRQEVEDAYMDKIISYNY